VQVAQQHVQAAQGAGALGDQVVASLGEQPQHHGGVLGGDLAQLPVVDRDGSCRGGIGRVGLAGTAGAEQPGAGGQLGGHVQHGLAGGDQLLGDAVTQPRGALHGPPARGPGAANASSCALVSAVVGRRSSARTISWTSRTAAVTEALCGSMPMVINGRLSSRDGDGPATGSLTSGGTCLC